MDTVFSDVTWGTLWRWVVSSLMVFFCFAFVLILAISSGVLADATITPLLQLLVILLSAIIGAIVVWSDDIPWPGDA